MEHITKEDLEEVLKRAVEYTPRTSTIDDSTHQTHHDFVQMEIERRAKNAKRAERFKQSMIGTIATAIVAGIIWAGKVFIEGLKHMWGGGS